MTAAFRHHGANFATSPVRLSYARADAALLAMALLAALTQLCAGADNCGLNLDGDQSLFIFSASEDSKVGSTSYKLPAPQDRPGVVTSRHELSLEGDISDHFALDMMTLGLVLKRPLPDRGIVKGTLRCVDRRTKQKVDVSIIVTIQDVNNHAPVFEGAPYRVRVNELTPIGSVVFSGISAGDEDELGINSLVSFNVTGGTGETFFSIPQPMLGQLVLTKNLDFDQLDSNKTLTLEITASDQGEVPLTSVAQVVVEVTDGDDLDPKFLIPRCPMFKSCGWAQYVGYTTKRLDGEGSVIRTRDSNSIFPTSSSASPSRPKASKGWPVVIDPEPIKAFDQDLGLNAVLEYSFIKGQPVDFAEFFSIDSVDGVVHQLRDVPTDVASYSLYVKATQRDNDQRFSIAELTIYNSDADELSLNRPPRRDLDDDQADEPIWRRVISLRFPLFAAVLAGVFLGACLFSAASFSLCACAKKQRRKRSRASKAADSARLEAIKRESVLATGAWSAPAAESRYMNTPIERTGSLPNSKYLSTTTSPTTTSAHSIPRAHHRGAEDFRGVPRVAMATPTTIGNMAATSSSRGGAGNNASPNGQVPSMATFHGVDHHHHHHNHHQRDMPVTLEMLPGGPPPPDLTNDTGHVGGRLNGRSHRRSVDRMAPQMGIEHQQQQQQQHPHHPNGDARRHLYADSQRSQINNGYEINEVEDLRVVGLG